MEGFGQGEAGWVVVFLLEVVELFFGVVGALETPENGGELVEEVELDGVGGAEGLAQLLDEDVVGGGAFVLEAWGLGAEAVFEGVLGGDSFAGGGARAGGLFGVLAVGGEFSGGDFEAFFWGAGWARDGFESGFGFSWRGGAAFD